MRRGASFLVAAGLVLALALGLSAAPAYADEVASQVSNLRSSRAYKVRLSAVLALSRARDGRAVTALALALRADPEATIRRVAALALGKVIDASTDEDDRGPAMTALEQAASGDRDEAVRETATRTLAILDSFRRRVAPSVFVNVGSATDATRKAPADVTKRLETTVRGTVKRTAPGFAVEWPGGLPSQRQLDRAGARAFIVAPTVAMLTVTRRASRAEVACTVSIRVAPWKGTDGEERWEASKAASASGSGKATTRDNEHAIAGGMRDCVLAVGEELTTRQVLPFIRRLTN